MSVMHKGVRCAKTAGAVVCKVGRHPTARVAVDPLKVGASYYCADCWSAMTEEDRQLIIAAGRSR